MSRELEIELEMKIAMKAVKGLLAAGFGVGVNDGEETVLKNSFKTNEIKKALFSTDEDYLLAYKDGKKVGWVRVDWGNVADIISDYTTNLEDALKEANEFANAY